MTQMTDADKIKYLAEHINQLRVRVRELEKFREDVLRTIMASRPQDEKDTQHD